jgi:hypothetical protein
MGRSIRFQVSNPHVRSFAGFDWFVPNSDTALALLIEKRNRNTWIDVHQAEKA